MASHSKTVSDRSKKSLRQSVTIPARLAAEIRRVAKQRHLTMSRAAVVLAARGIEAEASTGDPLGEAYQRFLEESRPAKKREAGKDLVRVIFGKESLAQVQVL